MNQIAVLVFVTFLVCLRSCLMQRYSQNAISSSSSLNEGLVKQQQHDAPQNHGMPSAPHQCVPFTILNPEFFLTFDNLGSFLCCVLGIPPFPFQLTCHLLLYPTMEARPLQPFLPLPRHR